MKDKIIDLVFNARPIWDKRHNSHHNRYVLAKEWKKVSLELGIDESEAKTIWKNLRQEYGKQVKKCAGKSGDAAAEESVSSWPFFEKMQFLKDQFTPRLATGNLTAMQNSEVPLNLQNDDNLSVMSDDENLHFVPSPEAAVDDVTNQSLSDRCTPQSSSSHNSASKDSFTRTGYRKRLTPQAAIGKELVALEREKLELAKRKRATDVNDEDVAFFNSLIPTVKLLPRKEKLGFRMKVQQLLYDFAFPETAPQQTEPARNPHAPNVLAPNPMGSYLPASDHRPASLLHPNDQFCGNTLQLRNMDDNTIMYE